jgi:hypothetical protein
MRKYVLWGWVFLMVLFICGPSRAADLTDGTYLLSDGRMDVTLMINRMPDGKFFVNANGMTKDGKTCRIGDLAELKGGKLIVGRCQMDIALSEEGFTLRDGGSCAQCEPGAYVSGSYKKQ